MNEQYLYMSGLKRLEGLETIYDKYIFEIALHALDGKYL